MELIALAEARDIVLQVGLIERFNPAVISAHKYISKPKFIEVNRLGPYDPRTSHIGVVMDLMIHDIDLLLTMMDSPIVSFEAVGASIFSRHEDIANIRMRFKNGCIADVTASRASMEACGEKTRLTVPLRFGAEPMGLLVVIETVAERSGFQAARQLRRAWGRLNDLPPSRARAERGADAHEAAFTPR